MQEENEAAHALRMWFDAATRWNSKVGTDEGVADDLTLETAASAFVFMQAYCLPSNWTPDHQPIVHFPIQLAADAARNLKLVLDGHVPNWMLALQKKGAPTADLRMDQDIGLALAYRDACQKRLLIDEAPVKTIISMFNVSRKTVENWWNKYPHDMELWFADAKTEAERAQRILAALAPAAERYRLWGRGTSNKRPFGKAVRRTRAKR